MSREECLNDPCPHDRHLDLMRMRQAKPCDDSRPSWRWCFGIAAMVIAVLAWVGAV